MINPIEIDLNKPFEHVVAAVLSLAGGSGNGESPFSEAEVRTLLRTLYEAANGRHVATSVGRIPIAPPVAAFVKAKPFTSASQMDFLIDVAARLMCGPDHVLSTEPAQKLN